MSNILLYYRTDFKGALLLTLNTFRRSVLMAYYSLYCRLKCKLVGVAISSNVKFGGNIVIERFPQSSICIGKDCRFNSNTLFNSRGIGRCILQTGTKKGRIIIGDNCGFSGVCIVSDENVIIGNNVIIGANSKIGDRDGHKDILATTPSSIEIGNNVFIGMGCIILKGVHIGENSIIAAGAVVTKNIPSNVIAGGVPCKVIKNRI